jgi:hypothetical protein
MFSLRDFDQHVFQPGYAERRDKVNETALEDMVEYMKGPAPRMVIYDAVNYNHARRMTVYQKVGHSHFCEIPHFSLKAIFR